LKYFGIGSGIFQMQLRKRKPKPGTDDSSLPDDNYGLYVPPDDDNSTANDPPTSNLPTKKSPPKKDDQSQGVSATNIPSPCPTGSHSDDAHPPSDIVKELFPSDVNQATNQVTNLTTTSSSMPSASNASSPVQWLKDPPPSVPNPIPRSARRSVPKTAPPFAHDPLRGPTLHLPDRDVVEKLNGRHFLSTALLDYVLQKALPKNIPENIIIGSSNSLSWFQSMNQKSEIGHSDYDPEGAIILRRKYQFYCHHGYEFIAANCGAGHFSVARVSFDINFDDIFGSITVYDSNRRSSRKNVKPKPDEVVGKLLLELQKFLCNYCFFGTRGQEILKSRPNLALEKASFAICPQQQNGYDCGLFSLGALLHLVVGFVDLQDTFSAANVTSLRRDLHRQLTSGGDISWEFVSSFFPYLRGDNGSASKVPTPAIKDSQMDDPMNKDQEAPNVTTPPTALMEVIDSDSVSSESSGWHPAEDNVPDDDVPEAEIFESLTEKGLENKVYDLQLPVETKDTFFCNMFFEMDRTYENLACLDKDMTTDNRHSGRCRVTS
jgi:hypothetical protein